MDDYFGGDDSEKVKAVWSAIADHEERLQEILLKFLRDKAEKGLVTIYGEPQSSKDLRVPVISFTVRGMSSSRVVEEVEKISMLGFRNGHMYSHRLLRDVFGLEDVEDGVVRISMLHYNTGMSTFIQFSGQHSWLIVCDVQKKRCTRLSRYWIRSFQKYSLLACPLVPYCKI